MMPSRQPSRPTSTPVSAATIARIASAASTVARAERVIAAMMTDAIATESADEYVAPLASPHCSE